MADVHSPETRSKNMRAIRARDTRPELLLRKSLHSLGFRYKLHDRSLPGVPDLVFPRFGAVVFVHGCFWHRHGCRYSMMPVTRAEFWSKKLEQNWNRDQKVRAALFELGWRVGVVWECALRGSSADPQSVSASVAGWIVGGTRCLEVARL